LIALLAFPVARFLAQGWLNPNNIPLSVVEAAIMLMIGDVALKLLSGVYFGALVGLQRHLLLNALMTGSDIIRYLGTTAVLLWGAKSVVAFAACQLATSVLYTAVICAATWRCLPNSSYSLAQASVATIRRTARFAVAMTGVSMSNMFLTQIDKIVLSKLLSLENFGFYSIATRIPIIISGLLMHPVLFAVNPRFSQLLFSGDRARAVQFFHRACQLISILTVSSCAVAVCFSHDIMLVWTQNLQVAENTSLLVKLLVCSSLFLFISAGPWILRYAHGKVSIATYWNVIAALLLMPMFVIANARYGVTGAVAVMIPVYGLHCVALTISTFKLFFGSELKTWLVADVLLPALASSAIVALIYFLSRSYLLPEVIWLIIALGAGLLASMLVARSVRVIFLLQVKRFCQMIGISRCQTSES